MKPHGLTHIDLFSGIGGFKLAAEWAGFETLAFSEIEPYACRVLAERWPAVRNIGDVRKRTNFADFAGRTTVLTGGFPCQPWSSSGLKLGKDDSRHLGPAMCGVIKEVRPTWVIGENVSLFVSVGLDAFAAELEAIGYAVQPFIIPACAVDARHIRERIWIVAHADGDWKQQQEGVFSKGRQWISDDSQGGRSEWEPEPAVGRVADGVPDRAHRLKGLGNAIVPQIPLRFFRWIAQIEKLKAARA